MRKTSGVRSISKAIREHAAVTGHRDHGTRLSGSESQLALKLTMDLGKGANLFLSPFLCKIGW
jgi:hypothetical protein